MRRHCRLPAMGQTYKRNLMPRGDQLVAKLSNNVQVYLFEIGLSYVTITATETHICDDGRWYVPERQSLEI
jgi:hypothetical protein